MTAVQPLVGQLEHRFVECLPQIEAILDAIAKQHALQAADADDFGAWAKARIIANDYAILGKFEGRSSLRTFLTVVLSNLFRDYRNATWGRWRPSSAAIRHGPLAVHLELLVGRDGCTVREAISVLRSRGATLTDRELARLAGVLPPRIVGEVELDEANDLAATGPTPLDSELRERVNEALQAAIAELPPEDSLLTRMRYWDGLSVADMARTLRVDQKRLYRRLEAVQKRLQEALNNRGVSAELIREALDADDS